MTISRGILPQRKLKGAVVDHSGKKFGKLTVLPEWERVGGVTKWKVRCECGAEKFIRFIQLSSGQTKSCGCYRSISATEQMRRYIPYGGISRVEGPAFASISNQYKMHAKKLKLPFDLTADQFLFFTKGDCYYCGTPPAQIRSIKNKTGRCSLYIYNGIDRVDSNFGYFTSNCVSCCWPCNFMKGELSQQDFFARIRHLLEIEERRAIKNGG